MKNDPVMNAAKGLPPSMNHIFVDFENVQEVDLSVIGRNGVTFTLFLGAVQKKLGADLVEKLLEHASAVQLVRLGSSGKNALDFAIAYYLGRAVLADPTGSFHIVSKDKGFNPLIEHLRSRQVKARRHDDFSTLTFAGPAAATAVPSEDLLQQVLERLRKNMTSRPKRRKTLASHLLAFLGKTANAAEVDALIDKLHKEGHLSLSDKDAVTYNL